MQSSAAGRPITWTDTLLVRPAESSRHCSRRSGPWSAFPPVMLVLPGASVTAAMSPMLRLSAELTAPGLWLPARLTSHTRSFLVSSRLATTTCTS